MTWAEFVDFVLWLGGIVASVSAVAWFVAKTTTDYKTKTWLQSHKGTLDKELETHRAELGREADRHRLILKRQELNYEREAEAAKQFYTVFREIEPDPKGRDPEWSDGQVQIAEDLYKSETLLNDFSKKYGMIVSEEALGLIRTAKDLAREGSYMVGEETQGKDYLIGCLEPSVQVLDKVTEFWETLCQANKKIRDDLKTGSL